MTEEIRLMRPKFRHLACAHPVTISWICGTIGLWMIATVALHQWEAFSAIGEQWTILPLMTVGYAALSGLGFFAGAFTVLPFLVWVCSWVNGAPHAAGDCVTILSGPHRGQVTTVYELTRGQGGQLLARADLGPEAREKFKDIFEHYRLLRTPAPRHPK